MECIAHKCVYSDAGPDHAYCPKSDSGGQIEKENLPTY